MLYPFCSEGASCFIVVQAAAWNVGTCDGFQCMHAARDQDVAELRFIEHCSHVMSFLADLASGHWSSSCRDLEAQKQTF